MQLLLRPFLSQNDGQKTTFLPITSYSAGWLLVGIMKGFDPSSMTFAYEKFYWNLHIVCIVLI